MEKLFALRESSPLRFGAALGYTLFVIIILIQPNRQPVIDLHIARETPSLLDQVWFGVGHTLLFAAMALIWFWSFYQRLPLYPAAVMAASVALLVGMGTEIGQFIVSSRDPSLWDLGADAFGILLTMVVVYLLLHRR
ncbi:MAG: VanZ family protein [Anaerolineae bacterium]